MAIYTLYPQVAGGTSTTFAAYELPSDQAAIEKARQVLAEHRTAESVAIWNEDQFVGLVKSQIARQAIKPDVSVGGDQSTAC